MKHDTFHQSKQERSRGETLRCIPMITGTITCGPTGFLYEALTEVLIDLHVEDALPSLNYFVRVHLLDRSDAPGETPLEPALMHQHGQHIRFRRVVVKQRCIIELFAASGKDDDPTAYGLYLILNDGVATVEERGLHITEDAAGKVPLQHVRALLYR